MRIPRPKSLNGLLVLGFLLVSLPLLLAIVRASSQMNTFASESEQLVFSGVEATGQNQELRKQLSSLERSARVYRVIGESELLAAYDERVVGINATLDSIATAATDGVRRERIRKLQLRISEFDAILRNSNSESSQLNDALEIFSELRDSVEELSDDSNRNIQNNVNTLQRTATRVQRQLAIQTVLLFPFTALIIIIFTALMARPLRQIDAAISALGDGQFSKPVEVVGPEDLEALGRQLEWLRERLNEQAREKDKFLRHMSHELKTPLANIREGTELLIDGSVGELFPPQKEVADILRENGLSLQKLIENLLSFSAWQTSQSDINLENVHLGPLIRSVIEQQRLTLSARSLKVKLSLADLTVVADKSKIRMVIDNLLTNAIKFSPDSGTIYIMTQGREDSYMIEIADEGPGIPHREKNRIFEPFYQGSTPQKGHVKGTGIGLSVVQECINAHGGKISIIDSERAGAHFRITIPLVPAAVAAV